jgi:hypothetical protein
VVEQPFYLTAFSVNELALIVALPVRSSLPKQRAIIDSRGIGNHAYSWLAVHERGLPGRFHAG